MFSKGYVHVLISFRYLGDEEDYGTDSESDSDCSTDLSSEYQKKKAPTCVCNESWVIFK